MPEVQDAHPSVSVHVQPQADITHTIEGAHGGYVVLEIGRRRGQVAPIALFAHDPEILERLASAATKAAHELRIAQEIATETKTRIEARLRLADEVER